uniref:DDE-1 domain-containing protein n=1 Tax=Heliothis virescens TaxID=7102 RepID=A0A2A4K6U7_HELVI
MVASVSDSGWISEQLFVDWLHHFKSFARPAEDNIILLILDNHESHISLAAYEFCKKNYIHVLTLPPHASHRMQPLDLTFHGPLKTAYNKECESFMVNKPGAKITTFDVVGLYTKAFNRTTNIEKAMNGFKAAGIYPLDKDKFKTTFENLADTTDPSTISVAPRSVASQDPNQSTIDLQTPVARDVSITISHRNLGDQSDTSCESLDGNESPSLLLPSDLNETDIQAGKSNDLPLPVLEDTVHPTIANLNASIPLSDIINMPSLQTPLKNKTRSQKTKHSIILTSTPEKEELEKKEKRKIERTKKKTDKKDPVVGKKKTKTDIIKKSIKKRKNTKTKAKKGVKNFKNFEDSANEEEYYCIICAEKYISPPTEDWIMCITCQKWAHENCTGPSTSRGDDGVKTDAG